MRKPRFDPVFVLTAIMILAFLWYVIRAFLPHSSENLTPDMATTQFQSEPEEPVLGCLPSEHSSADRTIADALALTIWPNGCDSCANYNWKDPPPEMDPRQPKLKPKKGGPKKKG